MIEQYQWYQLQPVDAWFFRDGRPSNRGEDQSDLQSEFPPHAGTVVGALRAALARQHGWDGRSDWPANVKEVLGDGFEDLGRLSFLGPFLARDRELLFPIPRHVLGHAVEQIAPNRMRFEAVDWLHPGEPMLSDIGEIRFAVPMSKSPRQDNNRSYPEPGDGFWVTAAGMSSILNGQLPHKDTCIHHSELYCQEARVGIERDATTRTTGKGALYNPRYVRLHRGVSLIMGIAGLHGDWQIPDLFPLGGESRLAQCTTVDCPEFPTSRRNGNDYLLTLVCPGRFSTACWWGVGPAEDAAQLGESIQGQVVAIATDRPVSIGGWDSHNRSALPLMPFAAPGTVWWIEGADAAAGGPIQIGERTGYGYGLVFLGVWPQ